MNTNNHVGAYEAAVREIRTKDKREGLRYWKNLLAGFEVRTEIPSFGEVHVEERSAVSELGIDIDSEVTERFASLCRSEDATISIGAQLAWGMVLATYARSGDVVFAKVVSGRDHTTEKVDRTIGLFINTVPVRMTVTDESTGREALRALQDQSVRSSEYDYCSLAEIQAQSELGNRLFQTVFSFQNYGSGSKEEAEAPKKRRSFTIKSAVMKEESFDDLTPVAFLNGDKLHLNLRFDKKKYRESEIRCILRLFETFVRGIAAQPDRALMTLDRVSDRERAEVMKMSTGPILSYDTEETWIDLFLSNVRRQPEHVAVADEEGTLTYRALDRLSDAVAQYLLAQGIKHDDFVVIKMHRCKEFAAAVIGIHKAGACYVPIDPDYPEDRIAFMESDCEAKLVLDREQVIRCTSLFPDPAPVHVTRPEYLAYMIYTSGSTGKPKGAMIPHRALMNYTRIYIRRFGVTEEDRLSHHITFSFDSHIRDFYPALAAGASLHFMSDAIVKDPALICQFLKDNRITGAAFATAMGQLLLTGYDLKLRFVSVGGEALRGITGGDIRVFNVCGATEVTDVVLDYELEKGRFYESVPIGKPLENCYAFILDRHGNLLPQGIPGEICYVGRNVGYGYWKRDDLTKAAFTDCPILPGMTMYHTGDLGRYDQDGNVAYMGRLDFQVKLRGFRIEPGEVESNAVRFPGIRQVAAVVVDDRLCLYYTADEPVSPERLKDFLSQSLAEYMVPDVYMPLEAMPLTPSGKIDRRSLPEPEKTATEIVPPEGKLEQELFDLIREQLSYDGFGVTSNLVSQGMSSLMIMRLSGIIQTRFHASVSVAELMKEPFIRNIAEKISGRQAGADAAKPVLCAHAIQEVYPATENQTGVYLDWELNRDTTQYNIPVAFCFTEIDAGRFAGAVRKALSAHPYLNTRFRIEDGNVVQFPVATDVREIPVTELVEEPDAAFFQTLVRPFDLNRDILYRFRIFTWQEQTWLFMDVHHILFDGLSESIFMQDVADAYEGQQVKREEISAYDFALYENEIRQSSAYEEAKSYFHSLLSDAHVMSYPVSLVPDGKKQGKVTVRIDEKIIDSGVQRTEVTAGSFIHAAFGETMRRLTREEKPVYLTVSNGRTGLNELDRSVGMFVKTVPVLVPTRENEQDGNDVKKYVQSVSGQLNDTYARELYPYTKLVEETGLHAEILFVYQGGMVEGGEVPGAKAVELSLDTLKFPLTVTAYPVAGFYELRFEYDGERYAKKDMEILSLAVKQVLTDMAYEDSFTKVHLLNREEEKSVIARSMGGSLPFDLSHTWLTLFAESVRKYSDQIAVADEERSLTYGQLDRESNAVAAYLLDKGVTKNQFVALHMDRCAEFVIAVTGIHKAGAAYLPIDMNYPEERRRFMLEDSEAGIVLTQESVREAVASHTDAPTANHASPDGYAYMIYTSGSTGRPKGTILHHRGLLNFTLATKAENGLTDSDRIGHHFSFSFDSHIEDLYPPLLAGASIHIMPESIRRDPDLIYSYLMKHGITGGGFTTSVGRILASHYELPQRYLALMGEALTEITPKGTTIINKYGPTECTNIVATYVLEKGVNYKKVPIGRSMPNGAVFLLDTKGELVPFGCVGELCYAGPQTGFGYWKLAAKTQEVFAECPWMKGMQLYHTGDLARYDEDGQLVYLGRMDDQVKVNGFRVEFGEIESAALRLSGVYQAAAAVRQGRIVLYYAEKREQNPVSEESLRNQMAKDLPDYMMPAILVKLDAMPLTPSGKVDRRALPEPGNHRTTPFSAPVTRIQKAVTKCLQRILGLSEAVGLRDNFFELGGDSIKAIRLVSLLRDEGITVRVADIMKGKTAEWIAEYAAASDKLRKISQEPIEGPVGLSPVMNWFYELKLPVPGHFNQSVCLICRERPVPELLQKSLDAVTTQHDMLRAARTDDGLVIGDPSHTISIRSYECENAAAMTGICNELQAGMKMEQALACAALFHVEDKWYLVLIAHHLIIDAVSWRIILSDLETAYGQCLSGKNPTLPGKTHTYRDYVEAMRQFADSYALFLEIPYWKKVEERMRAYPVSIPTDHTRVMRGLTRTMDRKRTERVLGAGYGKLSAEIDDALLAAAGRSYARIFKTNGVSFQFEGHGREDIGKDLVIDRTVGWFTSVYPMVVEHLSGDLKADFIRVRETRHRIPGKGVGYPALRYLRGDGTFPASEDFCARIGFNYLGEMDTEQTGESFFVLSGDVGSGLPIAEKNVFGPDLSINAAVTDGRFSVGLTYNTAICTEEMAAAFTDGMLDELMNLCDLLDETTETEQSATDLGETEWSPEEFEAVRRDFESRGQEIKRIYPLTPMQESMLLKHISEPESMAYRLCYVFELDVLLSEETARRAVMRLITKHEVLRTAFIHEGVRVPRQAIIKRDADVEMTDLSDREDPRAAAEALRLSLLSGVRDLQRESNFRVVIAKKSDHTCYLFVLVHHMLVDGWCNSLYLGDLYRFLLEEHEAARDQSRLPDSETGETLDGRYEQAVRHLLTLDRDRALSYWEELLKDYEGSAEIPSYGSVPEKDRCDTDQLSVAVDRTTTRAIEKLCRQQQATLSNAVELLWGLVLQTFTRSEDVVFAKVVSGRDRTEDADRIVGLFINSVPVRVKTDGETTARQMLSGLREQSTGSAEWDFCPLVDIQKKTDAGSALVRSVLAFENYNSGLSEMGVAGTEDSSALPFTMRPVVIREEVFGRVDPLTYIDGDGQLTLRLSFDKSVYTGQQIRAALQLFAAFAEGIAAEPDRPVALLPALTGEETDRVLSVSTGEDLPLDDTKTWLDLFYESVEKAGASEAVTDASGSIRYDELNQQSDAVAAFLLKQGVGKDSFVAIRMDRVKEYVVAILGVHKAGAAFIPVDPALPDDRKDFMLKDAGCHLVLDLETVCKATLQTETDTKLPCISPSDRAYMIYTSGSTGEPKGVVQSHRSLYAFATWRGRRLEENHTLRHGQYISFSFDASLDDLICPLCAGGRIFILDQETRNDLDAMDRYIRKNRISSMALPAQIGMAFINAHPDTPLETLVMGGENLLPVKKTAVRLINEYGPTEFTVCSSRHEVDQEKDREIPIGRPVPGTSSLILDEKGRLLPLTVVGELCLAGDQIAEGYFNRPELTGEKFVELDIAGERRRVYRTGDLARYDESGELVYHGRLDRQLKIRGFRVEPGEIENCAVRFPGVLQAAVDLKEEQLVLFYTSEEEIDENELKTFLSESLTDYMVPSVMMRLMEMPLTANGKIDYKRLPETVSDSREEYVAPVGTVEKTIAEVIREFLGLTEPVGALDDFFALGGDSIKVIRMIGVLREAGIELKAADVMKAKTVRAMAALAGSVTEADAKIDQEPYSGRVEDTAITGFFRSLHLKVPAHFNQTLLVKFQDKADPRALSGAWHALTTHHDMLRAVWTEEGLYVREGSAEIPVEEYTTDREHFAGICDDIQRGIRMDQTLVRAALIHAGDQDLFFVAAHHLIIDSVSWSILQADLETVYKDALHGRKISLPPKTGTYRDYAKAQHAYRNS
nr:amino acid adenylation domain-containing protein [Lachnospiraceae bacterium]